MTLRTTGLPTVVLLMVMSSVLWAQAQAPRVGIHDHGPTESLAGPGAPAPVVGLMRISHDITLNTGAVAYGLRYTVGRDPADPAAAVPGEGYIGMSRPVAANWYAGGFFDLKLNGQSIGTRMVSVFAGHTSGERGYVDYVFDNPQAVVRVRMVGLAGSDCLHAQVLVEPRVEINEVGLHLRCYPSGFITGPTRRVLTASRTLATGARVALDREDEWWLNCYDTTRGMGAAGDGPCSVLWAPLQTQEAVVSVGSYSVDANLRLEPALRDFRFVFFDHTGRSNADVQADLRERAPGLVQELIEFEFADAAVLDWPLAEKQETTRELLAALPEDEERTARYEQWSRELEEQLKQVRGDGNGGAILAEAGALKIIMDWERSLPDLRLEALLHSL